jgi:DNA polymerase III epsilon subunit-like protein
MSLYVIADTETTGFNKVQDRILSYSSLTLTQNMKVVDARNYFVCDCRRPNSEGALEANHLDPDFLAREGIPLAQMADTLYPILQRSNLVAHNVSFDSIMLQMEMERCGYAIDYNSKLDTMTTMRPIMKLPSAKGGYKNPKLIEMCEYFGVTNDMVLFMMKKYFGDVPAPDGAMFHLSAFDVAATYCCLMKGGWQVVRDYYELN